MLSDEEKKAVEGIKKDDEYYDILENIKQNKYNMWNVEKLMRDTTNGDYTEYEIAQSIVYFVNLIEKQQKEIEENKKYIIKMTDEQYSKVIDLVEFDTNKKWKDKIKAKIEEVNAEELNLAFIISGVEYKEAITSALQSLLEKE